MLVENQSQQASRQCISERLCGYGSVPPAGITFLAFGVEPPDAKEIDGQDGHHHVHAYCVTHELILQKNRIRMQYRRWDSNPHSLAGNGF